MRDNPQFLDVGKGPAARRIAWRRLDGEGAPVVWLGGFKSDMESTKALAIEDWCRSAGRPMIRMDYSGHGVSPGDFRDGTISRWAEEARAVLEQVAVAPAVVVGSSMGGWIATLLAKRWIDEGREGRLKGLVLIAPACDFTEELMWPQFPDEIRRRIMEQGSFDLPSAYSMEPTPITRALIEDGRRNRVFGRTFRVGCPVHILQGMKDPDVPWGHALRLVEHLPLDIVLTTLVNDGDHWLSRPQDIERLIAAVRDMG